MNIVCPNCGTSYDVEASALGPDGRTVRCVRCRETWHARIDDVARADALVEAADEIGWDQAAGQAPAAAPSPSRLAPGRRGSLRKFAFGSGPARSVGFSPSIAIAAMAALVVALIFWRNDVVRLLPQTAAFFQFAGLGVNLRNLAFEDVRVSTEMVNGNQVFVIEGAITPTARKAVEIPRLRFVVQDARGADIYAWNSVVDQAVVKPGEKVAFKSRLASPPADAHSIVVRFFNRRDLASGSDGSLTPSWTGFPRGGRRCSHRPARSACRRRSSPGSRPVGA